jgi:hypothetical protein
MKNKLTDHKVVGDVHDLQLTSQGSYAYILATRDHANHTPIILGQFVILANKKDPNHGFLCVAEEYKPDLPMGLDSKAALRQSKKSNIEVDELYSSDLLFLGYKCRLLGVCKIEQDRVKYYSNVRSMPSVHELEAAIPSAEFMKSLFMSAVEATDNSDANIIFELGFLRYGTNPDDTECYKVGSENQVPVQFNVSNMIRKRTAIFGKSGYGKSNNVKVCIGMIAKEKPNCGQLIFDTNGEYALDNDQNQGFMDIFYDAGMKNKVVLYSNKTISSSVRKKHGDDSIKPLKFDVFANIKPSFEIVESNLDSGKKEPMYLTPWISALNAEDDSSKFFTENKNPGLVYSIYYAALIMAGLRPFNEEHNGPMLQVSKKYLDALTLKHQAQLSEKLAELNIVTDKEMLDFNSLPPELQNSLLNSYGIFKPKNSGTKAEYFCKNITHMSNYALWWKENEMKEESSMKGFTEILANPRRFYALTSFHLKKTDEYSYSQSLGEAIFSDLQNNKIVILDLASVNMKIAKSLANHIAAHLLAKASSLFGNDAKRAEFNKFDALIYIEEAQNYLSKEEINSGNSIYERLAKEGRKFHLGLVYVTQQPSAIDQSITSQTENIIALHMSNEADCMVLNKIKDKFDLLTCRFLKDEAAKGLAYIYAEPHQPFVLPCQIKEFNAKLILGSKKK